MDMGTCVARRTRSRTELYMNSIINKSKGGEDSVAARAKRASMRNARSLSPANVKRRRKKAKEDGDDVEFVGTVPPQGKHVQEDRNVDSSSVISPDRVCDFAVNDVDLRDEERTSTSTPDADDAVVFVGTMASEHENVEDVDNVVVASPRLEEPKSPVLCDFPVDVDDVVVASPGLEEPKSPVRCDFLVGVDNVVVASPGLEEPKSPFRCDFPVDVYNVVVASPMLEEPKSPVCCDFPVDLDDVVVASPRLEEPKSPVRCDFPVDVDNVVVASPGLEEPKSPPPCDFPVDDADLRSEERTSTLPPSSSESVDVISISDEDCGEDDDSDEDVSSSDSSDYEVETSDSSYTDSSDSDFVNSEDDEVEARGTVKVRKSPSNKGHTRGNRNTFPKSNAEIFQLLTKSTWERTKIFEEDTSSGDETAKVHTIEDAMVTEEPSEEVHEQRKPKRSYNREKKEKIHSNVSDLLENSFWRIGEGVDGGENPWDGQEQETINLRFGFEEPEPVEKTEEEREIERLWEDMALALRLEGSQSSSPATKNGDVPCINGTHDFVLDEEIGLKCCYCSYVAVEIKDISPAMDNYHANVYDTKTYNDKKGNPSLNGLEFEGSDHHSYVTSLNKLEGTVWEYIPGVKDTLYPYQQEGFEFLWKNLAGTTKLDVLENSGVKESGGCIISHDPGSGKTRLTIVFLQSYLERFPDSRPVVIAPASVLLTWQEEFIKWNANIPFYNMNSLEFTGHEDQSAVSLLKGIANHRSNKHSVRMVKLYSWSKKKSVLGVSYPLYEKLAGKKCAGEILEFRRMLLELPGLLVLDEGHTPRNQTSCIWKVLTEVRTDKRIILSGTPFQNNFKELSNVLCLARPAYTDLISSRLQDLSKWSQERQNGRFYEEIGIVELRAMIAPFVHVHRKENGLPGLKDCVVVLNPPFLQQKILDRIDNSQNTFELEHKLSAVSVHPSLYLHCKPTRKEHFQIGKIQLNTLEKLRLVPKEGVKTRFLVDFIRLSEILKEKVLVFSQYIDTLKLIRDQLCDVFGWKEGEEILLIHGKVELKDRQHQITNFNEPDSKSKVLLASTKSCSEGINLVGASRVLLLDVVWNPSVEKQAISRAYRIGQKRVVYTYHLMVKGTSEWDKYCKQTQKQIISELVFSSASEQDKVINKEVVSEDRILDEMVRHEKQEMFEKIVYHPKDSDMSTTVF